MTATLYCYFKIESDHDAVRGRLAALQAELAAAGWPGQLLRRCDDADTWMEVYSDIVDREAFRAAWLPARRRRDLTMPVHEEWFQQI
ncbi:DUF4936 domain-containing protein [Chromobacterium sp. ATCC 53434]|uniref:DUF4936 family protein n=1 Tax=Chromobacterium sp. (strain ATCC 53434 / SC 14030) TaxID=2059672 RepID=UPI000C76CF4E|nr:DUF4936 family protein [Chromobacterium sp. ATCC 53434]AUH50139.1 DUF4936 domain-containing protein [Chromobacterium sp. ATCC 53434]